MASTKNNHVADWADNEDNLLLLESWARDGYTVADIALRVGVHASTFRGWMADYPKIKKAVNSGRELVDYKVENALLKAALGFQTREVKVVCTMKHGRIVEERKEVVDKEYAPNVSAITAWLYNRQPKKWKNMNSKANMFDDLDEDTSIHITIERATPENIDNETIVPADDLEQDDQVKINTGITLRKATVEEQRAAKQAKKEQAEQQDDLPNQDWQQLLDADDTPPPSRPTKQGKSKQGTNRSTVQSTKQSSVQQATINSTAAHADDPDYWPDDWEDQ